MCPKKEKATDYQWLLSGWQDSNPWSLHRNIWLHLLSSYELFRPAATAPTAFIIVFVILKAPLSQRIKE